MAADESNSPQQALPSQGSMRKELYDFPEIMQHLQTSMNALSHFHSEAEFWKEKALRAERLNETLMASVTAQEEKMEALEARVLVAEHRQATDPMKVPPPPPPPPRTHTRTPPSRSSSRSPSSRPSPDWNGDKPSTPPSRDTTSYDRNMKLSNTNKERVERNDNLLDTMGETMSSLITNEHDLGSGTLSGEMMNKNVSSPNSPKPEDVRNTWSNGNYTSLGLDNQGTRSDLSPQNTEERDELNIGDDDDENQDDGEKSVDSDNSSVQAMRILNSYLELKNDYAKKTSARKATTAERPIPGRSPSFQTFEC